MWKGLLGRVRRRRRREARVRLVEGPLLLGVDLRGARRVLYAIVASSEETMRSREGTKGRRSQTRESTAAKCWRSGTSLA